MPSKMIFAAAFAASCSAVRLSETDYLGELELTDPLRCDSAWFRSVFLYYWAFDDYELEAWKPNVCSEINKLKEALDRASDLDNSSYQTSIYLETRMNDYFSQLVDLQDDYRDLEQWNEKLESYVDSYEEWLNEAHDDIEYYETLLGGTANAIIAQNEAQVRIEDSAREFLVENYQSESAREFIFGILDILGDEQDEIIEGGEGNDDFNAGEGDDIIQGGNGDDIMEGGEGNDILSSTGGLTQFIDHHGGGDVFIGAAAGWGQDVFTNYAEGPGVETLPNDIYNLDDQDLIIFRCDLAQQWTVLYAYEIAEELNLKDEPITAQITEEGYGKVCSSSGDCMTVDIPDC